MNVLLIASIGVLLAAVNGANDVSKGIATLAGSGVAGYRRAILWGTIWTACGSLAASVLAGAMVTTFGTGLLAPGTTPTVSAATSTLLGAAAWVLIATRTGLPVSTTHAILGALAGVGAFAYGVDGVRWSTVGGKILLPLVLSPFAALILTGLLVRVARWGQRPNGASADCFCAEVQPCLVTATAESVAAQSIALMPTSGAVSLIVGDARSCALEHPGALRLSLDHLHWLTSGATSFARGMNDAPKMAALILVLSSLAAGAHVTPLAAFALVTGGMVAGSIAAGLRVTRVLAEGVTEIDHRGGFLANLVTSLLVIAGATAGLPMSTTHVSTGAIIGVGSQAGRHALRWSTIRHMVSAWILTLPGAALLGILSLLLLRAIPQ